MAFFDSRSVFQVDVKHQRIARCKSSLYDIGMRSNFPALIFVPVQLDFLLERVAVGLQVHTAHSRLPIYLISRHISIRLSALATCSTVFLRSYVQTWTGYQVHELARSHPFHVAISVEEDVSRFNISVQNWL